MSAQKLKREDLYSLEKYAEVRPEFRQRVMAHKKNRRVQVGPHATFYFEDRLTMHYQVQEMLRAERIYEATGIQEELNAYNPLIPDGCNWKATFMMEYEDVEVRARELAKLIGVEDKVWMQVGSHDKVYAIADEDLERENAEKTSSVHFLRFELTPALAADAKQGVAIALGIDHPAYSHATAPLPDNVRASLVEDLA
jgi:hypothetical protein